MDNRGSADLPRRGFNRPDFWARRAGIDNERMGTIKEVAKRARVSVGTVANVHS
jgi:hypothetical protein